MTLPTSSLRCPETPAAVADLPCDSCDVGHALAAKNFDCRAFRDTLGNFATGVTVVTALAPGGEPIGLTISSFNSVSLDPPLVLWSLSVDSPSLEAFRRASHYAVNVLAAGQQDISNLFAARNGDRFAGLPVRRGAWIAIDRGMLRVVRVRQRAAACGRRSSDFCRARRAFCAGRDHLAADFSWWPLSRTAGQFRRGLNRHHVTLRMAGSDTQAGVV